jgi:hypothetical protein
MENTKNKGGRPKKSIMEKTERKWITLPLMVSCRWPSAKIVQLVMDTDSGKVSNDAQPVVVASAVGSVPSTKLDKVANLKAMLGIKTANELDNDNVSAPKPFETIASAVKSGPRLPNTQHNALIDRFVDLLKSSTTDGIKAISAQLSQWEEQAGI